MTMLVVSPHLDDAVLSVPGLMRSAVLRGERVVVLTVFSEGDAGYAVRRAEDLAALALLGVEAVHLGLRDAPFRRGLQRSFRDLVLAALPGDDIDAAVVIRTLVDRIAALAPTATLLPLGVGEHIDHRIVHRVHSALPGPVGFYEDRPYARVEHAVRARLLRLGATVDGAAIIPSGAAVEGFLAAARVAPYVRAYVPAAEREACLRPLAAALAVATPASGLALRRERLTFTPAVRRAAARAIDAYASQLADLFGDDEVANLFAEPYAEHIFWRAASTGESTAAAPTDGPGVLPGETGLDAFCRRYVECGGTFYAGAQDCIDQSLAYWGECASRRAALDDFGACMSEVACSDDSPDAFNPASTPCAQQWDQLGASEPCN